MSLGKNILAVFLGIAISFFLLEGLLRIFEPIEYHVKGNKIVLPRDKKYELVNDQTDKLDRIIATQRNHLGFRGEMPPTNFSGALTIIAVGGSTTACEFISDGKTWCDLLANKLKGEFKPCWLNNAGLDGVSTYGHLILMEDYLIKIRPKVALFLVGANEIGLADYCSYDRQLTNAVEPWLEKLVNGSEVLSYVVNFYRYSKAVRAGLNHAILNFAKLRQIEISPEKAEAQLQAQRQQYLRPYRQRLTKLIELSRANGIEPVLITQPTVCGDLIDPATGVNLARVESWAWNGKVLWEILELYNDTLRQAAAERQVQVIDLAREMPKNTDFFYDTYHFTNAGCQRVAEIINQHLGPFLADKFPQYAVKSLASTH